MKIEKKKEFGDYIDWFMGVLLVGLLVGLIFFKDKPFCEINECYKFDGIVYKPEAGGNGYVFLENGTPCIKRREGISCNYNRKLFVLINGEHAATEGVEKVKTE